MKARTIGYWTTTGILSAELLTGGVWDLTRTRLVASVVMRLGYPPYVLAILGIWKLLAVAALLVPGFPRLKEWTYAGIVFEMTGAAASHAACGDGSGVIAPLVFAVLAVVSWRLRPQSRICGVLVTPESTG